jgi:hypothetical protein
MEPHFEPEPEPEPEPVAMAMMAEEEAWRASQKAETAKALALLDEVQAVRDAEDQAHIAKIRSRTGTPDMLYSSPTPPPPGAARQRTTELLSKISELKTNVAHLDAELGWDAAKSESAEDAARNARVRMDAEARAAARAAAAARAQAEAEAEAAAAEAARAAAVARAQAQQDAERVAREAEAAAADEAARKAAAEAARLARLDGALVGHHERWRAAGEKNAFL